MSDVGEASRSATSQQVNVTLDAHWHLVLRQASLADGKSVPDLLRPVVVSYLKRRMKNDDLAEAVARIEKIKNDRARPPANVAKLPVKPRRRSATRTNKSGKTG